MGIAVLGPLEVDPSTARLGPRDRVVLSTLVLWPGETVTADRLADVLWRDEPPKTWAKVIQGCIMRLRKTLGGQVIETSARGYRLIVPIDDIDVGRFERLVRRSRELLAVEEPERASYLLAEAIGLWRGTAFEDLEGWDTGRIERDRLDSLRLDAEELLVDARLRCGHAGEVVAHAQTLVSRAPLRERRWSLLALAQYQSGRQSEALQTIRQVRRVLAAELGLDPGPEILELEGAILRQDPALVAHVALPELSQRCPYLGLVPYDVKDSDGFFGRDADVTQCLRRLAELDVLVVVGASGSGKSSLVRAGVAAALARDGRRVTVVTPGTHPMDALTNSSSTGRRALVVDQCEEALTLCDDPQERTEFFRSLATEQSGGLLVVALRADHLSDLAAYPAFARLVERGLYLLGDLAADDLRECIEAPARQAGLLLEPGLVDLLVREVEGEPGGLPLLSHALRQTWTLREGRTLTVSSYAETGGIRGAVARTAEDVYARIPPDQQDLVRDLMLRLAIPGPSGDPVRSQLPRRMIPADEDHHRVIEQLVSARLVTSDDGVLVLAHEAVTRAWPRLRQWLEDDTAGREILQHLPVAADTWQTMGRPDSELYRGSRLARALEWKARTGPRLSSVEQSFLDASRALDRAELRAARERADSEASARRRTVRLAVGLTLALVLTIAATGVATYFQRSASHRADDASAASLEADANRLAALSGSVVSLDQSLLLAAQAAQMADTTATQDGLVSSLVQHQRATQVVQLDGQADDVALASAGRVMFVARHTGVFAWSVGTPGRPSMINDWDQPSAINASESDDLVAVIGAREDGSSKVGVFGKDGTRHLLLTNDDLGGWPLAVGLRPDSRRLLVLVASQPSGRGGWLGTVHEIDVDSGKETGTYPTGQRSAGPNQFLAGAIADDGSSAVAWRESDPTSARRVDLRSGSSAHIRTEDRPANPLGFRPLRIGAAQTWSDGSVTLYDRVGRATQVLDVHESQVNDLVVSPDRTWAASADNSGAVVIWSIDAETGTWSRRESLVGHTGSVTGVAVDPTGTNLVTASRDGTAITWDLSAGAGFGSPVRGLPNRWISNAPAPLRAGDLVVAATRPSPPPGVELLGGPGTLSVFATFLDPATGRVVDDVRVSRRTVGFFGSSVSVSPDGAAVAVTHGRGATVLDTRTRSVLARIDMPRIRGADSPEREFVWCSAWTPDGSRLLLGADGVESDPKDGNLLVVDTETWEPEPERIAIGGAAQTIELSPDKHLFAIGMSPGAVDDPPPGEIKLLDATTLEVERVLTIGPGDHPFDVAFSPDGTMVATGGLQGRLTVFDVGSGRRLHEADRVHSDILTQAAWLPDNQTVVTTGMDGMISLYDARRGLLRVKMPASGEVGEGYTFLTETSAAAVTAASGAGAGRTYPLNPRRWLEYACLVAGRDLTRDEWDRYLDDLPYRHTCADQGRS